LLGPFFVRVVEEPGLIIVESFSFTVDTYFSRSLLLASTKLSIMLVVEFFCVPEEIVFALEVNDAT
jgi:hypothetical protein